MKANSNNHPGEFTKSRGKRFFNFNIIQSEKTDEHGTRTVFDYDQVEIAGTDKNSKIRAIIRDKYSIDDEIALINNKLKNKDIDSEYDEYQTFRAATKVTSKK